jgi:hypothetical protein
MAAKTLRKKRMDIAVEISVKKLMKIAGKPADLLGNACVKRCGYPVRKQRISGG